MNNASKAPLSGVGWQAARDAAAAAVSAFGHASAGLREGVWDWFRIGPVAAADGDGSSSAEVFIYEQIGYDWWTGEGITAKGFTDRINALDVDEIQLHLNSPGGLAWDGVTIMNALRAHKARVVVTVDGLAASAASVIAMAGDEIVMNRGSQMMIHDASTIAWGDAAEMAKVLEILDKLSDSIADVYSAHGGGDRAHWRDLMKVESWFTAEEAVTAGLADRWVDAPAGAEAPTDAMAQFDLSMFAHAGRSDAPAPRIENKLPRSSEPGEPNRKVNIMSDVLSAGLRERLGVTDADASDETLLGALDEALAENSSDAPAAALPEGVVPIDATVLADLRADAAAGRAARDQQNTDRRDALVQAALNDGRISAGSVDQWSAMLEGDEERATALLNSMPKNAVPVAEIGHQEGELSEDDRLAAAAGWAPTAKEA